MSTEGQDTSNELVVEEPDCAAATEADESADQELVDIPEEEFASLEAALAGESDEDIEAALAALGVAEFLRPGGGWDGSQAPVERAMRIARRNRLQITSRKRSTGSTGSDHHTSQRRSYAADLSNGSAPTPEMDRTARQIAAAMGHPGWRGGYLVARASGNRMQLIWRAPDHYDHVHGGVRRGG